MTNDNELISRMAKAFYDQARSIGEQNGVLDSAAWEQVSEPEREQLCECMGAAYAVVQSRVEELEAALETIRDEARREGVRLVHLKWCIANAARTALSATDTPTLNRENDRA